MHAESSTRTPEQLSGLKSESALVLLECQIESVVQVQETRFSIFSPRAPHWQYLGIPPASEVVQPDDRLESLFREDFIQRFYFSAISYHQARAAYVRGFQLRVAQEAPEPFEAIEDNVRTQWARDYLGYFWEDFRCAVLFGYEHSVSG
jgi:hypothetical protein